MSRKTFFQKMILWLFFSVLLIFSVYGVFFIWKINKLEKKISADENPSSFLETLKNISPASEISLRGYDSGRINILLLGIAGTGKAGKNLSDTIMVMSLEVENNRVGLFSIPRDLWTELPEEKLSLKINTAYQYGISRYPDDQKKAMEPITDILENITSLKINYWAVVNFQAFEKIIDTVGGIHIFNERDIFDPKYPGPNFSYETFELEKGFHLLDGKTALKYARMRHSDPEGDFGRAKRQQQVMQAVKNKIYSTATLLDVTKLSEIMDVLGENIQTNIEKGDLENFLKLSGKLDTDNVSNVVLDAWNEDSLLKVSHLFLGDLRSFILVPRIGNWSEVEKLAQNIFDIDAIKREREEIKKEEARLALINRSGDAETLRNIEKLLRKSFHYENLTILYPRDKKIASDTFVHDFTDGQKPFTLNELAQKIPAKVSYEFPSSLSNNDSRDSIGKRFDLVLIIGEDAVPIYSLATDDFSEYNKFEENSQTKTNN